MVQRNAELSWVERARVIFFHLHPLMGGKDVKATAKLFNINQHTLASWLTNKRLIPKWYHIVQSLDAGQVIESMQKSLVPIYTDIPSNSKVDLRRYEAYQNLISTAASSTDLGYHHHEEKETDAFLEESRFDVKKEFASRYLNDIKTAGTRKRVASDSVSLGRKRSHQDQEEYILQVVRDRWESGSAITKMELRNMVLVNTCQDSDFYRVCCDPNSKGYPGYLNKFISRVLERGHYVQRKKLIIERVPADWRQRAQVHANEIVNRMKLAQIDSIVAADEMFIRFHAPNNAKDLNTSELEMNGVYGCVIVAAIDLVTALFVPPLIVFIGGPVLNPHEIEMYKQRSLNGGATVIHTCDPSLTPHITISWLTHLRNGFPNKKLGVILDSTSAHMDQQVTDWIHQTNELMEDSKLLVEYVENTLTCVYHPFQAALESSLKQCIYTRIGEFKKDHITDDDLLDLDILSTERCPITRERLVMILEEACNEMSNSSKSSQAIPKAFRLCGLDPLQEDAVAFEAHLDTLSVNVIYDRLLSGQQCIELI